MVGRLAKPAYSRADGHCPFPVQFSTMATQNLIMTLSNCTDGQSKFQLGQPNPKPCFQFCYSESVMASSRGCGVASGWLSCSSSLSSKTLDNF